MLTIQVNTPVQDKNVLTTIGTISLSESVTRVDNNFHSRPALTVASTVVSGLATDLLLDLTLTDTCAENTLSFMDIPGAYETVTLSGITYTFIPLASGYNSAYQVRLGSTTFGTALNFHKVLNRIGTIGTDYPTAGAIHPTIKSFYASNPLILRAITKGIGGNTLTSTTTSSAVVIAFDKLYNGGITYPNTVLSQRVAWVGNDVYYFDPVNFHPVGVEYEGTAKIYNDTNQLVNAAGTAVIYTLSSTPFYGKSTVNEFIEVPNLSGIWADNGQADSSGEFYVTWDTPAIMYSGVNAYISAPGTTGTPTQTSRSVSAIDAVQPMEYNVFIYVGSSAPERNWPRSVDANGTWYWAGKTTKTYAHIHMPSTTKGIWVGWGNKYTYATTVTNLNQTLTTIYI